jgi:hypothetical protein
MVLITNFYIDFTSKIFFYSVQVAEANDTTRNVFFSNIRVPQPAFMPVLIRAWGSTSPKKGKGKTPSVFEVVLFGSLPPPLLPAWTGKLYQRHRGVKE